MPVNRLAAGLIACALAFLSACTSEPPPVPPAELTSLSSPRVSLTSAWRKSGLDAGRSQMQPLPLDDSLFVATRRGVVISYDRSSGATRWRKDLNRTLGAGVGGDENLSLIHI